MNPISRFLLDTVEYAALFYTMNRVVWAGEHSPAGDIPLALLWGLIMQALVIRREGFATYSTKPRLPQSHFFLGFATLNACLAYWAGVTFGPTRAQLYSGIALGLNFAGVGLVLARRRIAQRVTLSNGADR